MTTSPQKLAPAQVCTLYQPMYQFQLSQALLQSRRLGLHVGAVGVVASALAPTWLAGGESLTTTWNLFHVRVEVLSGVRSLPLCPLWVGHTMCASSSVGRHAGDYSVVWEKVSKREGDTGFIVLLT